MLAAYVGERARGQITQSHMPDTEGWVTLDLPFESFITARTRLSGTRSRRGSARTRILA